MNQNPIYFDFIYLDKRTRSNSILSSSTLVLVSYYNQCLIYFCFLISFRSRRTPFDLNKSLWGGYAIWNKNYKFYFAGDTGYTHNIPIFKQIGKKYGPFDLSAIPIGAYEPRWVMEGQHVSPHEAVQMHIDTQSKKSIAIHWGTWALASEYYLEPRDNLIAAIEASKLNPDSFIVLKHGETFDLP
jgi:N-acyl-phosphatidylethanolamine-hydrolysing phospholipase D